MKERIAKWILVLCAMLAVGTISFALNAQTVLAAEEDTEDSTEAITTGWVTTASGNTYYYKADGTMVKNGWYTIDGKKYFFNASGRLHYGWRTDATTGYKYYCDPNTGVMQTGWKTINGKKYFFNNSGRLHYGWRTDATTGYKYYCDPKTGVMQTGWKTINGKKYFFNNSGRLHYGWRTDAATGYKYYCDPKTGVMQTGWQTINGKTYFFNTSGRLHYGWRTEDGVKYYFNEKTGVLETNAAMAKKAQSYTSSTNWLILVDSTENQVGIFYKSGSTWVMKYCWDCCTGKASTPTVKGTFTVKSKGKSFSGSTYTCWYYTQFYGNYLFHSVLYKKGSMTVLSDGRLGDNLSHGCVRLSIENAKWIYDNIPVNTKVVSY